MPIKAVRAGSLIYSLIVIYILRKGVWLRIEYYVSIMVLKA